MSQHIKMVVYLSCGLLAVFAWHFATVFGIVGTAPQTRAEFFVRFGIIAFIYLVASAVTAGFIASKDENALMPDEREEQIEARVERNSVLVLYAGLILLMWFVFTPMTPMQVANAILGIVCVAELIKIITGLRYLRHGL